MKLFSVSSDVGKYFDYSNRAQVIRYIERHRKFWRHWRIKFNTVLNFFSFGESNPLLWKISLRWWSFRNIKRKAGNLTGIYLIATTTAPWFGSKTLTCNAYELPNIK